MVSVERGLNEIIGSSRRCIHGSMENAIDEPISASHGAAEGSIWEAIDGLRNRILVSNQIRWWVRRIRCWRSIDCERIVGMPCTMRLLENSISVSVWCISDGVGIVHVFLNVGVELIIDISDIAL